MSTEFREIDYYAILNLPQDSSGEVIHEQYRRLAKVLHPDRNAGDPWCQEQLKLINDAYSVLADTARKSAYDQRRANRHSDQAAFTQQLDHTLSDEAAAVEERRRLRWVFDTAAQPEQRESNDSMPIQFVARPSSVAYMPAPFSPGTKPNALFHKPLYRRTDRTYSRVLIICAALAAALYTGYVAAPLLLQSSLAHHATPQRVAAAPQP